MRIKNMIITLSLALMLLLSACGTTQESTEGSSSVESVSNSTVASEGEKEIDNTKEEAIDIETGVLISDEEKSISAIEGSILDVENFFTSRDLEQIPDLTDSVSINLVSDEDIVINTKGVYVLSGDVNNVTVIVEVDDEENVQLVLDKLSIVNEDAPAIYVRSGDKVFVTTTESENYLEVSGTYIPDGDVNLDAVIYSKSDLVLNGLGTLEVESAKGNGITSKDDLKITGGHYIVNSYADAIEANDSIRIYDGDIVITTNKDGLHSENEEDDTLGYIYIQNGTLMINAVDDAIRANSVVQIDGGTINIEASTEGIEGTYIQINGGNITLYASDDGINATSKSSYDVVIEVNGGNIDVTVGSGDTDGFDANGDIFINGGIISVNGQSSFDADGVAELNGGEVTVNGEVITEITQMQMGKGKGPKNK